ncbi:hypothetical protein FANTH_14551 [Fusarium anthophilum]|uniref:Uncharacterized protein n=1 Tax=Fusarium anthophilum TaxID=48485 RepID=A0A8H5DLY6_9HYPO|nr:hypothetical protein FANTH_14551 [Fusarium anthophilum]
MDIDDESLKIDAWAAMDIDSEHAQKDLPKIGDPMDLNEDNALSNAEPIDNQNTVAWTPVKTTFEHNAFGKRFRGNKKLKRVKTRMDGVNKLSRRKPKNQLEMATGAEVKQYVLAQYKRRQLSELSKKEVERIAKRKLARITSLYHRLIGREPLDSFADNCEKTIPNWILLLRQTSLPNFINSSHHSIITAFKAVDNVICGTQGTYLLRRLAYVQLMRLFTSLEALIKSERESGKAVRKQGCGDASIAIDIYMSAQQSHQHPDDLRRELKERKRAGKIWRDLSGPSPLFTMVYSHASESIMYEQHHLSHIAVITLTIFKK